MVAMNVFAAQTEEQARFAQSSAVLGFAKLRQGNPGPLPYPVERLEDHLPPDWIAAAQTRFTVSAIGDATQVKTQLSGLSDRYKPDEVIINAQIHDHQARLLSIEMAAKALRELGCQPSL